MRSINFVSLVTAFLITISTQPSLADSVDVHVSSGGVSVGIDIGRPPPARVVEVVPEPRSGHIWVPGYWAWEGNRHVWVKGAWEKERPGYAYEPGRWEQHGERWHFEPGSWKERKTVEYREDRREEHRDVERREERRGDETRHEEHRSEREERRDDGRY